MKRHGLTLVLLIVSMALGAQVDGTTAPDSHSAPPRYAAAVFHLSSAQPMRIKLDGTDAGTTPITLQGLSKGSHRLLASGDGGISWSAELQSSPEAGTALVAIPYIPAYGSLKIESTPSEATVMIDGKIVGTTPVQVDCLSAGKHEVSLQAGRFRSGIRLAEVTAGSTAVRIFNLKAGSQLLFVPELPAGTLVRILDEKEATILEQSGAQGINLLPGAYTVCLSAPGLSAWESKITIDEGMSHEVDCSAYVKSATLVMPQPEEAVALAIDGLPALPTDLRAGIKLPAGAHVVDLFDAKGRVGTVPIFLAAGDTLDLGPAVGRFRQALPDLTISPADAQKAQNRKIGEAIWLPILSTVVAVAGFVLNIDLVSATIAQNYQEYEVIKYASLGAAGLGVAGFSLSMIPVLFPPPEK